MGTAIMRAVQPQIRNVDSVKSLPRGSDSPFAAKVSFGRSGAVEPPVLHQWMGSLTYSAEHGHRISKLFSFSEPYRKPDQGHGADRCSALKARRAVLEGYCVRT